ncbi:MAG: RNA pseudouridine synthase [Epulopiscium sp. Nele67-Bin004]|nr:MAG: RNA pseudouridine synthase [Epulopiscium sp. Nele67-Bin004]
MTEKIQFIVEQSNEERIDKVICAKFPDFTRSFIQKQIEDDKLYVNGKIVKSRYKVKLNDSVELLLPELKEVDIQPENIPLQIVFEDDDIIIVNKEQGMVVHPAPGHYSGTLVNALMYHCKDSLSGINGEIRPGIVHRIDKDTSGLLMVAKNDKTHLYLSNLLKEHNITRKYHAVVYGVLKEDEGIIDAPIARSTKDRKKMAIVPDGREAKTHYKVITRFKDTTYVELTLFTGRTHQIRVHLTSIGHPLLGDPVYGRTKHLFGLDQQILHAKVLGFVHPTTGEQMYFESELPDKFKTVLDKLYKIT